MSKPIKEGWLTKQGGKIKTWKKRWFALEGTVLSYAEKQGKKLKGSMDLSHATSVEHAPDCKKQPAFKVIIPSVRTYYIVGSTKEECQEWIDAIKSVLPSVKSTAPAPAAAAASESTPDADGKPSLDNYDVLKVLGRGTYGKVQLVRSKLDGKVYAMKTMGKRLLEETEQIEQTIIEKDVLLMTRHPFLVSAHATFQTPQKIFMVLDYVPGGELFGRLKEEGKFSENRVRLYAAEMALGIGALHSRGLIYRDLKPENILIDAQGHIRLTDFGLVKTHMFGDSTTTTFCGTPEYIAPEMLNQQPYTKVVDWWSFGIIIFEMLTGLPPFYDENTNKMYRMILQDKVVFPPNLNATAVDLISKLLEKDPSVRLGGGDGDVEEIKKHPFFESLNWDDVLEKKYTPEWVPDIKNDLDTSNFDQEFTAEPAAISFEDESLIDTSTQLSFQGFTCAPESALDKI